MRIQRILVSTAALTCLAVLPACKGGTEAAQPATPTASPSGVGGSLAEAQRYLRQFTSCEDLSARPDDPRLAAADVPGAGQWSVRELGVCSDRPEKGDVRLAVPADMKAFQAGYKKYVMDKIAGGDGSYGLESRVLVGRGFVAVPTRTRTAVALVRSDLRVLTCNPTAAVPEGYKREKALVEGCILSDFVNSEDGQGSPNLRTPQDPAAGATAKPGRPAHGSLGLPAAGSMGELKKLVASSVDCSHVTSDPALVAVESIDYAPVVQGDPVAWGLSGRALCGETADGQRAHGLSWLDTVSDMKALQTKAKAAQLADLKEDGRLRATQSLLLVGENIAVETNDPDSRFGLYQLQFLSLNCVPGFSAPAGYRLEKAQVDGCVLTNYEPEHPLG